jgi:alkylation response protein AidB-like acyl-CoA dehydrogenase
MANLPELLEQNRILSREVLAPGADRIDQLRQFPRQNLEAVGRAGLLGLLVPQEFGGAGGGLEEMSEALEVMAQHCPSTAMVTLMHHCGTAVLVAKGRDGLKRDLLPRIARGEHLSTLAFSEPGSGGHFYFPVSEVSKNGRDPRLTASKSFVTSAGEADSYVVSTRRNGATGPMDIDLYLVSSDARGLTVEGHFEGLGLAGNASAPMKLQDVAIDDSTLLGPSGSGFQTMMELVVPYFQIGVASVSIGIAGAAFQSATAHASKRRYQHASETPLAAIPRVQFLEAEMALELRCARAYVAETIRKVKGGDREVMLDLLGVKVKAAEAALAVTSRAMTIGGGSAFGRRGGLERIFRDAQSAAVMAPFNDVLKEFIGKTCLGLPLL